MKNDALRKILPRCYGFGSFDMQGRDGVALLTERVDETMGEAYAKMRILEPSSARTTLMLHMIMRTVTQMKTTADEGKYCLRDWHVHNIAFNCESQAGSDVDVKLIDWSGHLGDLVRLPRNRMESAMNAFLKSLPGPHSWGGVESSGSCESEESNIKQWKSLMQKWAEDVKEWWGDVSFPTDSDLGNLNAFLTETLDAIDSPIMHESSSESRVVQTVPCAWSATASSFASVRLTSQHVAGRD